MEEASAPSLACSYWLTNVWKSRSNGVALPNPSELGALAQKQSCYRKNNRSRLVMRQSHLACSPTFKRMFPRAAIGLHWE